MKVSRSVSRVVSAARGVLAGSWKRSPGKSVGRVRRFRVSADGKGVCSRAGVGLLRELAIGTGVAGGVTAALADTYRGPWLHAPGQVFVDVACAIADGAKSVSGIRHLRDREDLHGPVASMPTAFRLLQKVDTAHAQAVREARARARAVAWAAGAAPEVEDALYAGWLCIDLDATITTCDSEKENAAATFKKTFGHHPLLAFLDRPDCSGGEALAGLLRPGNAGSNTAVDHIEVLDQALAGLPPHVRPGVPGAPPVLIRSDSAGATHAFAAACRDRGVGFSFGHEVTVDLVALVDEIPEAGWSPAVEDEAIRAGAWVAEITDAVGLSAWPEGTRLLIRKERPHPGAQLKLNNTTADGMRLTAFITDTQPGQVTGQAAGLELRHRRHARVEDRIREAKNTGLRNLPLTAFSDNQAWLLAIMTAIDLVCWAKLLCFHDVPGLAHAEIDSFRYHVLHVAAQITTSGRRLHLKIDQTWHHAQAIATGWMRLRAAFP